MSVTPKTEDTESKFKNIKLINGDCLDILQINIHSFMILKGHIFLDVCL